MRISDGSAIKYYSVIIIRDRDRENGGKCFLKNALGINDFLPFAMHLLSRKRFSDNFVHTVGKDSDRSSWKNDKIVSHSQSSIIRAHKLSAVKQYFERKKYPTAFRNRHSAIHRTP